jgi:hypothetical protein
VKAPVAAAAARGALVCACVCTAVCASACTVGLAGGTDCATTRTLELLTHVRMMSALTRATLRNRADAVEWSWGGVPGGVRSFFMKSPYRKKSAAHAKSIARTTLTVPSWRNNAVRQRLVSCNVC